MADELTGAPQQAFRGADAFGISVGLVTFAAGILMLLMVFRLSYALFGSIDDEIEKARVPAVSADAAAPTASPEDGRTLSQVAAAIGLKLAVLFVMGYAASLVSAKGAQLLAAHRARPTIQ